jgi:hypothetical protein
MKTCKLSNLLLQASSNDLTGRWKMGKSLEAQETASVYADVVCLLNDDWRIICCQNGLQWILQYRAKGSGQRPWTGRSYCQTRKALVRNSLPLCGHCDPAAWAILEGLPETINELAD